MPPIVFLHEGLGSAGRWRDFPERLGAATGRAALVYSRYGNGFSEVLEAPREPSYMHEEARSLIDVLDATNVERAILYGHSDGGSIALIAASRYPSRVAGAIVEAPHVFVEGQTLHAIAAIGERFRADAVFRERFARHHRDGDATFWGWNRIWLDPRFAAWSIVSDLRAITAPILCLQGDADSYGSTAHIDAVANLARGSVERVVLQGCEHAPHAERPDIVLSHVRDWLPAD